MCIDDNTHGTRACMRVCVWAIQTSDQRTHMNIHHYTLLETNIYRLEANESNVK